MKKPNHARSTVRLKIACSAVAALTCVTAAQAQVTFQQVTNGLVGWYPLDFVVESGSTLTTPDFLNGRDLILSPSMSPANVVVSTRPSENPQTVSNCFNLNNATPQTPTVIYYNTKGQDPLTGEGDFLPFCNQVDATMSFWIKANAATGFNDARFFGEADGNGGNSQPLWLWGSSSAGNGLGSDKQAHFLFRFKNDPTATPDPLADGTFQEPDAAYFWAQGANYTASPVLDGNWHLLTMTIDSNRVIDIYVDGVRDEGPPGPAFTDMYGNPTYGTTLWLTNFYYTTNVYPSAGVSNPPPNGYVRWVWNNIFKTGSTAWGGFRRTGTITGGFPMSIDDIAFWNRRLSPEEVMFVYTNGLTGIPLVRPLLINSFTADFAEVGQGDSVTLNWNVTGAITNAGSGGIVISGVGDVSAIGLIGSTNVTLPEAKDYVFTLTVHNGIGPDTNAVVTVKTFPGVDSDWHLIQRFDGVFEDTFDDPLGGVNGNSWISAEGDFSGLFDKWNVFTVTNNGGLNKVITPRTGYVPSVDSFSGYQSRGALSYARLGSLTIPPGESHTLFFRFSLADTEVIAGVGSDMDFAIGLSDYGFLGPSAGLGFYGGTGGGLGPYVSIIRNSDNGLGQATFLGAPFNLFAPDTADPFDGNTAGQFSYTNSVNANGLDTNVNYMVWIDVMNRNTHAEPDGVGGTNTVQQALYSVWLQKQGEPTRTLLFTNFHGNRNYVGFNPVNDGPTPFLNKVFLNLGSQTVSTFAPGAYITTNMIMVDDIYLSKSGFAGSVPRLFDITSVVRDPGSTTIRWNSLGSLHGTNTYTVQRKFDLTDASWTTLASGVPSGGDTTTYIDNTVGAAPAAYYRIVWP